MKQVLQDLRGGKTKLEDVPVPRAPAGGYLIRTTRSVISPGTERMLIEFGQSNLLQKARSQPERVREVLNKIKTDGLLPTLEAVFAKLDEPLPLGYCNAGVVVESAGASLPIGARVASNGAHAEFVVAGANLAARIPDGVSDDEAAFTVLGAIAMQGVRLAAPTIGETVFVIGLGVVGLLTAQILRANGCRVIGSDFNAQRLQIAREFGCETVDLSAGDDPIAKAMGHTRVMGVDAVLITASTDSNDPVRQAAEMCRQRGRIVLVGVTGLQLDRKAFFKKELTFQVSCSYGPGRYDEQYESGAADYPAGFVRWTEQRNFEAVLELMRTGALNVTPLITHRFAFANAEDAYAKVTGDPGALGIVLEYESAGAATKLDFGQTVTFHKKSRGGLTVGLIGPGNFARRVILPELKRNKATLTGVVSSRGVTASAAAKKYGAAFASTDPDALFAKKCAVVFVATRHNTHADYAVRALAAGAHTFVEKPLAINLEQLRAVCVARAKSAAILTVGFNRRFSPHLQKVKDALGERGGAATMTWIVNAGRIPRDSWIQDAAVGGGRVIGEACHFIDALRWLAGSPIIRVDAMGTRDGADNVSITLGFEDGSIGTVHYWTGGPKTYPKERLIAMADGAAAEMDNFRETTVFRSAKETQFRTLSQDKGHRAEIAAFLSAARNGSAPPVPFDELVEVTLATFAAVEAVATGAPQLMSEWAAKLAGSDAT
ncbi:bi-domain-containing oxidoreductase [soil metagenome]